MSEKKQTGVTISEYARHRGISRQAVQGAIRRGHISRLGDGTIDVPAADAAWADSVNRNLARGVAARTRSGDDGKANGTPHTAAISRLPSRAESERLIAYYRARLLQFEAQFAQGKWLDREGVERVAFKVARGVRDKILAIPDRVGPEIAGIADIPLAIQKLRNELTVALEELAEGTFQ